MVVVVVVVIARVVFILLFRKHLRFEHVVYFTCTVQYASGPGCFEKPFAQILNSNRAYSLIQFRRAHKTAPKSVCYDGDDSSADDCSRDCVCDCDCDCNNNSDGRLT